VNGLSVSKPVLINGYPIGRVAKLTLLPNGQILAQLKIHHGYDIPKNTIARLENTDLLGGKAIVFMLGNSSQFAKDGDTLSTNTQKTVIEQVEPIQQKASQIISRLDSILSSVNGTINPEFQRNFERSFASIARTLESVERTAKKVDGLVGTQSAKIGTILGNVESISANFKSNNDKISSIIANLDKVSDDVAKANIAQTITQTNKTLANLQSLLDKVNTGQGSLGLLLNDKQLYTNLTHATDNLDKLMIDLKANPKRYVSFSVFGGGGGKKPKK
jgi:phospholipid/cholesterol/gamma-HCH transport system substrate-binding protein